MSATQIIGNRIKELRKERKITQSALAKELNVPRQIISYYETGTRVPNIDDLAIIAKFFNVSSDYLLGLTDSMSADITEREISNRTGINEFCLTVLEHSYRSYRDLTNFVENTPHLPASDKKVLRYSAMKEKCIIDIINFLLESCLPHGTKLTQHLVSYNEDLKNSNEIGRKALEALPALDPEALYSIYLKIEHYDDVINPETFKYLNGKDSAEEQTETLRNILRAEKLRRAAKYDLFEVMEFIRNMINSAYEEEEQENTRIFNEIKAAYYTAAKKQTAGLFTNGKVSDEVGAENEEESPNK